MVEFGAAADMLTSANLSRLYGLPIDVTREDRRTLVWMGRKSDVRS